MIENSKAHESLRFAYPSGTQRREQNRRRARISGKSTFPGDAMTAADAGPGRTSPPIAAIIVLIPAAYCYLTMVANLSDLGYSDAAGNALTAAFAVLFGFAVWVLLGVLLVIAGVKGNIPAWAGMIVAILLPASAITSTIASDLSSSQNSWVLIEPYALPPLIAAYAFYARLTGLHRAIPLVPTTIAALVAMTILTLVPMPQFIARERARAVIEAEREAARKAADEAAAKVHAENLAKFEALTPASPLADWAPFFGKNNEFDERAIAAARKLPHRQEEAIDALHRGMGFPLAEYSRLDLQPTPEFCAASRDFLIAAAASHPGSPDNRAAQDYFDPMLGAVELLTKENCDLDAAVKAINVATATSFEAASFRASLAWRQANGFFRREDYDRAIAGYSTAISLSPDFEQYWADRGDAYLDKLEYAKAIPDYTEAIRINQGYSTAYNSRGFAEHSLGNDDRALADFDKAIEWRRDFPRALYNRGDIYLARGDLTRAIADYDAAVNLSPKMSEALARPRPRTLCPRRLCRSRHRPVRRLAARSRRHHALYGSMALPCPHPRRAAGIRNTGPRRRQTRQNRLAMADSLGFSRRYHARRGHRRRSRRQRQRMRGRFLFRRHGRLPRLAPERRCDLPARLPRGFSGEAGA
jgi:tetratricopeptide (TPR) repeat protein